MDVWLATAAFAALVAIFGFYCAFKAKQHKD